MSIQRRALALLTLMSSTALLADARDRIGLDLAMSTGNALPEQTYLDNYPEDKGQYHLHGLHIGSRYQFASKGTQHALTGLRMTHYPQVNTTNSSAELIYRFQFNDRPYGMYAAYDHTQYDQLKFQQIGLGIEFTPFETQTTINVYLPFGSDQSYAYLHAVDGATLFGMHGKRISVIT